MARPAPSKPHRSDLRTAAESADMRAAQEHWDNDGGQMCVAGRIVLKREGNLRYAVILTRDEGGFIQRAFATMREAEAFLRRNTPVAVSAGSIFERPADARPS